MKFTGRASTALALMGFTAMPSFVMSQGVNLGGGIITRSDVQMYADVALDVRDMRGMQDSEQILRLYLDGRNAEDAPGFPLSLQKLNERLIDPSTVFTPNYLFHLFGLAGLSTDEYERSQHYADSFIRSTIASNPELAAETIVALNMWMYATHVLNWGVDLCAKRSLADDPDWLESLGGGGMDEFIALWIGAEQTAGTTEGHGLYAWAEEAASMFDTKDGGPDAPVNSDLKVLYQRGAEILSLPHVCTQEDSTGVKGLWSVAQTMISRMCIPQVQKLLHALLSKNEDRVALYSMALVPQIAQCRPSVFKRLNTELLESGVNFDKTAEIINDLELAYDCFGLTCEDIGNYKNGGYSCSAEKSSKTKALAGYQPSTAVGNYAKIDHDILQMRILGSMEAFHFAQYIYQYGRNSPLQRDSENDGYAFLSLHDMAVSASRKNADPIYSYYVAYFNKVNYADVAVMDALKGVGKWKSTAQRTEVIVAISAFQIVFLTFLAEMKEAVRECRNADDGLLGSGIHPWDEVAALAIGSLEGPSVGGSSDQADGQLLWNLGNRRAFQFQTINNDGYSVVNDDLDDLLFAGKGALDARDCDSLDRTVARIQQLAIVPMVQSTLRNAIIAESLSVADDSVEAALGEIFAFSVLPILSAADGESAVVIRENMEIEAEEKPVRDGAQTVADALGAAAYAWGVECPNLGFTPQADPCSLLGGHSLPRSYEQSSVNRSDASLWVSFAAIAAWMYLL